MGPPPVGICTRFPKLSEDSPVTKLGNVVENGGLWCGRGKGYAFPIRQNNNQESWDTSKCMMGIVSTVREPHIVFHVHIWGNIFGKTKESM